MAGGTFVTQNKVRPGVYINFVSEGQSLATLGDRGVVTMALPLSWGASKQIITIEAGDTLVEKLGYGTTEPQVLLVREALKRAQTLLLYRLNTGVKATKTFGTLVSTAKYGGVRGNDISHVIQQNIDDAAKFDVLTLVAGQVADSQTVALLEELKPNNWVTFSGTGAPAVTAGVTLAGGTDGTVTNQDHADYLSLIELFEFNTAALVSTDAALKSLYVSFVKRLRDNEGRKVQIIVENYPNADYEGVISVKNGVKLSDGTTLTAAEATVWTAAATAGAQVNQSLTYQAYDDAVDAAPRYTGSQIEAALKNGEFVFVHNGGRALVEQDINSFKSFTPTKGKHFAKNRTLRVLDGLATDWKRTYETSYVGKVDNNVDGRNLFRKDCVKQAEVYQGINAIQNFNPQKDVTVQQGAESDAVYAEASIQPVDAIEKIYLKVKVG